MSDSIDTTIDDSHMEGLDSQFIMAMEQMQAGHIDRAAELLRNILKVEPRLAEPHLELARILLDTRQLDEAAEHAAESMRILEAGGQWIDDLPDNVVLSAAYGLFAEIRRQQASVDEVVYGNPEAWAALMNEARAAFNRAHELDSDNEHAAHWAEGLSDPATESP